MTAEEEGRLASERQARGGGGKGGNKGASERGIQDVGTTFEQGPAAGLDVDEDSAREPRRNRRLGFSRRRPSPSDDFSSTSTGSSSAPSFNGRS